MYAYVDNDPVNKTDPSGLFDQPQTPDDDPPDERVTVYPDMLPSKTGGGSVYFLDGFMLGAISGAGGGGGRGKAGTEAKTDPCPYGCNNPPEKVTVIGTRHRGAWLTSPGAPGGSGGSPVAQHDVTKDLRDCAYDCAVNDKDTREALEALIPRDLEDLLAEKAIDWAEARKLIGKNLAWVGRKFLAVLTIHDVGRALGTGAACVQLCMEKKGY